MTQSTITEPVMIETERLTLRPWRAADAAQVQAYVGEWELARMTSRIPHPYTRAMAEAFVAGEDVDPDEIAYAVDDADGLVGSVGLKQGARLDLGYWIGAPHRGKGYAGEAARAMCALAFETHGAAAVHACVFKDNPASSRVLEKLGFAHVFDCMDDCRARGEKALSAHYELTQDAWRADDERAQ